MAEPAFKKHDHPVDVLSPQDMGPDHRKRLSGPGLRSFLAIADQWKLSEKDRLAVLGHPSRSAYYNWVRKAQDGDDISLNLDMLLRISAVLGIHKALSILFQKQDQALVWLNGPHRGLPFSGQAPADLMTSGTQDGLMLVRRYLDAWRGGSASMPVAGEFIEPVTRDTVVFG